MLLSRECRKYSLKFRNETKDIFVVNKYCYGIV